MVRSNSPEVINGYFVNFVQTVQGIVITSHAVWVWVAVPEVQNRFCGFIS